jgi:hypothetical protein
MPFFKPVVGICQIGFLKATTADAPSHVQRKLTLKLQCKNLLFSSCCATPSSTACAEGHFKPAIRPINYV